jgi:pimeloyl-ACP methyl ester carboxylesterase
MHDEGLEALPKLLEVAGIRECVIIGHSDGGSIGIIYAGGTHATILKGLITEAAHVFCEKLTLRSIKKAKENFLEGSLRKSLERYHGANTDGAFWGWNEAWLHEDFPNWNIEPYLADIKVPLLAIQGEDDHYGTTAQIAAIAKGAPKAEILLLPGCGHSPHREAQVVTLKAMTDFIGRLFG